jgi:DNA invertase Pin-like site-specific DNA recombinase
MKRRRKSVPVMARGRVRAALYFRMSTEHQQVYNQNQTDTVRRYANVHGIEIVRTYASETAHNEGVQPRS